MGYPSSIPKYRDDETKYKADHLNIPIIALENGLNYLKEKLDQITLSHPAQWLDVENLGVGLESRAVTLNEEGEWVLLDSLTPLGEVLNKFPLGIASHNKVYHSGIISHLSTSIIVDGEVQTLGVPYFLSPVQPGKLTRVQPSASIFMGMWLDEVHFYLSMQFLTVSHIHRRMLLTPSLWSLIGGVVSYPLEQFPLPPEGSFLILDSKFSPPYGKFIVDSDSYLKLTDQAYFESLLSTQDLLGTVSNSDYLIELFYSDPRTLTTPGVMALRTLTPNLSLENNIPGQPTHVGSLKLKCVPTLSTSGTGACVTSLSINPTSGEIQVVKDGGVKALVAGSNVQIEAQTGGAFKISSNVESEREEECSDIALLGASSQIDLLRGVSFIKFGSQEEGAMFKLALPSTRNKSKGVNIYLTYSASAQVPVRVRLCSKSSQGSWKNLTLNAGDMVKILLLSISSQDDLLFLSLYGTNLDTYSLQYKYFI